MRDAIALAGFLDSPNVKAFLAVIRAGEGTSDPDGYRRHFGGSHFDGFSDHPRKAITAGLGKNQYTSTAAGAYQFLAKTWDGLVKRYGFADFEPRTQDIAALALIDGRKALDDVIAGRFDAAVKKCSNEWASLPGSPYGQPTKTLAQARSTYLSAGGSFEQEASAPEKPIPQETTMSPIVLPLVMGLARNLMDVFTPLARDKLTKEMDRHTDNPEVAGQIATSIIDTAKALTGKSDPVEAVAAAKAEPEIVQQVEAGALETLDRLGPILDKMAQWDRETWAAEESSRDAAAARRKLDDYDMARPLLFGSMAMVAFLIVFVGSVAVAQLVMTGEVKTEIWAALTALIGWATAKAGSIYDYRFGTSRSSGAKDVVIGELSKRKP